MTSPSSLPSSWREVPFETAIDFREGPGILARDFRAHGIPLIRLAGLSDGASVLDGCDYLDPDMVSSKWSQFRVDVGDILLSTSASLGRIAVVDGNAVGAIPYTGIIRMRPNDETLFAPFIRYLLEGPHFQQQADSFGVGSVIRHFGPMHLRQMRVQLPPLEEQRAIAHILGALDDKIELNRRMNETLESMARALFTSWFVDFEPVRAKMDGRWRRGESLPGLPADMYDLFPDTLVPSQLGDIPEGWEVKALGEAIELNYGKALKADDRESGEVPVYGSNGQVGWHNKSLAPGPGIVVGRKGNPGFVTWTHTAFFPIDTSFYVGANDDLSLPFLYFSLIDQDLPSLSADSAVPGLNRNLAYMNKQLLPTKLVLEAYHRQAIQTFIRRYQLEQESRALAEQRDALLPRLVNGEVRV